jgi:type IV pilus assembly protein PilC
MAEPIFLWRGIDREGRQVQGEMLARTSAAVKDALQVQRIRATSVSRKLSLPVWLQRNATVSGSDVTRLTRQLATLLQSGVPLLQALDILKRGIRHTALQQLVQDVRQQLEGGQALHQALQRHTVFDNLFCNLVAVGEMAGMLDTLLERIAHHREKAEALRSSLRSALIYPSAVLSVALIVMALLLSFVVPAFEGIFQSFNAELPALTRFVISLSAAWQRHGWTFLLGVLLAIWASQQWAKRSTTLQWRLHGWVLQLPIAGTLTRQACMARWTRTLATLFAAGITLTDALDAVKGVTGNLRYQAATETMHSLLMQGRSLAQALENTDGLFSPMVVQMCAIGEESGALDRMLDKTAEHYEREVTATVAKLSTLMEPFIMVVLGLLIGGLVVALYLPIFQLGQVV